MDAFFQSMMLVAAAEMGDKTQLLTLVLFLRYGKLRPLLLGILCATLLNHGLAAWLGKWIAAQVDPDTLRYILSAGFVAFAGWVMIPDKDPGKEGPSRFGPFLTTLFLFFIAEIGDKTQLATTFLAASFQAPWFVTLGTTAGMMIANGLAIIFGRRITEIVPMNYIRILAAAGFLIFGLWSLISQRIA
jgi:putative Ca2+/H+ antiporter (TMEM165/GDT1 family)